MTDVVKVPRIRFGGFTDPWEQRKFSQIVKVCSGRDYKHLEEGNIPVYGTGGYMTSVCEALSYNKDAIGIGRKGTIDNPYVLKAPFWTVDTLFYAIPGLGINLDFAHCCFLNVDWAQKDESTGLPSLSKQAINETVVLTPSSAEQNQIGAFFSDLDNLITLHQRKHNKLCTVKKSLLEKMFPKPGKLEPEIRFEGFTDPWEQRKLGELFEEYSEKNRADLPPLTIIQGGGTVYRDESNRNLQFDKNSLSSYKAVNPDDFIVHLRSFEGGLEKATCCGLISPAYHTFHGEGIDSDFYYLYFRSKRFIDTDLKPHVYGIRDGRSIDIDGMKTISIPWTTINEQRTIGGFFKSLDNLITLHQRKLELLRNIKKALLARMFV